MYDFFHDLLADRKGGEIFRCFGGWHFVYIILALAASAGAMHRAGMNHRDCYLCHYLLDNASPSIELYVIDLHRAQLRKKVPRRYLVKDLGGLLFSSFDANLTMRDRFRFVAAYTRKPLREALDDEGRRFWQKVWKNAEALYRKEFGREPLTASRKQEDKPC